MRVIYLIITSCFLLPSFAAAESVSGPNEEAKENYAITLNYIDVKDYGNMFGMNVFIFGDTFGFYGTIKTSGSRVYLGDPYFDNVDVHDAVDPVISRFKVADFIAIGATWNANDLVKAYLGGGYASNQGYAELYGPVASSTGQPVINQNYYVNDAANSSDEFYLDGGVVFTLSPFAIQLGSNSLTESLEIGIGFASDF